jgi:hypothetical protein
MFGGRLGRPGIIDFGRPLPDYIAFLYNAGRKTQQEKKKAQLINMLFHNWYV